MSGTCPLDVYVPPVLMTIKTDPAYFQNIPDEPHNLQNILNLWTLIIPSGHQGGVRSMIGYDKKEIRPLWSSSPNPITPG